ncbi:MAG TPA: hypothetical protein VMP01_27270 [Pirellulaceae bacterium]|nr:hypothetical protein [Pirellulaceae bacterium]
MCRHLFHRLPRSGMLSLALVSVLTAGGCALFPDSQPAQPRASDTMGEGLRGIPDDGASAETKPSKEPFWERYRDKRVQQINNNLSVEEPGGW